MAIFDRLDRMVSRVIDRVNATRFVIRPMKPGTANARATPDAARAVRELPGIFDYYSVEHGVQLGVRRSYREANDLRALQTGRDPQLSIDRRHFTGVSDEPRQGDLIEFPGQPSLPTFEVVSVQRDGMSRVVLMLTQRGTQG